MPAAILVFLSIAAQPSVDPGFLTVRSDLPGITVYADGDYLGRTPVEQVALEPGSYLLTIVSNDSLENVYARIRTGPVGRRLSAVWTLVALDAGTFQVDVRSGADTEVALDYGAVLAAPTRAKWYACCGVGSVFGIGALLGVLVGWLAF